MPDRPFGPSGMTLFSELEQRPHRREVFFAGVVHDQDTMIKSRFSDLGQARFRVIRRTFKGKALLTLETGSRFRQVDLDIRRHGDPTAFAPETVEPFLHGREIGVVTRRDPAVKFLCRAGNPNTAGPTADENFRPTLDFRPRLYIGAIHGFSGPKAAHQRQCGAQFLEPGLVILSDGGEIILRGTRADTPQQPVCLLYTSDAADE